MNSIAFLLPKEKSFAVGGYKIVFEYANRLAEDGYEVYLVYASTLFFRRHSFLTQLRILVYHMMMKWKRSTRCERWFDISDKVKQVRSLTPSYRFVPKCDVYVATAVQTAFYLQSFPDDLRKIYFIQGYEVFSMDEVAVRSTFRMGFRNVVISRWLQNLLQTEGIRSELVPNGFDPHQFYVTHPIHTRSPYRISFMYHVAEKKGCREVMEALANVKKRYPELTVAVFSAYEKPDDLPDWYEYIRMPDPACHREIYNQSSIYVAGSHYEGWGLTVGEAMMCGCAVVCADNDGFREMVIDEKNGLLFPAKDVNAIEVQIVRLIEDRQLREQLARQGCNDMRAFDIEQSYCLFRHILLD